jgi:hypothetical protein
VAAKLHVAGFDGNGCVGVAVYVLEYSISLGGSVNSGRGLLIGELVHGAQHSEIDSASTEDEHTYDLLDASLCL